MNMNTQMMICMVIFAATLVSYMMNKIPMWLTAMLSLTALYFTGCIDATGALAGFSNANTLLMATMFIVAAGFRRTSLVDGMCDAIMKLTRGSFLTAYFGYILIAVLLLIAPTSHERIAMIAKEAEGFVYCVSSLGVTGMRTSITTDIGAMVKLVKAQKDIPCAVGFGISTPEQAKKMADQSDGAIVGSAIVKLCGAYGKDCVPKVKAYVKEMKDAIR